MAVGGLKEGEVLLYKLQTEQIINRFLANFEYPRKIAFDPTGKYLFVLDYWTHGMFIWNLQTNNRHPDNHFNEQWDDITCIDFDLKDLKNVAMGTIRKSVQVVNIGEPKELFYDKVHIEYIMFYSLLMEKN